MSMKRILLIAPLLAAIALVAVPASAQEQEEVPLCPCPEAAQPAEELSEEEKQAKLAEIAQKLEEVEREVLRLSLVVTKLALEEQALVLQQRVEEALARAEQGQEEPSGITQAEPEDEVVPVPVIEEEVEEEMEEPAEQEEPFSGVAFGDEEDEEQEERGFAGAFGPFQNIGTPELATMIILALLGAYLLMRRLRERGRRAAAPLASKPVQPQGFQPSAQGQTTLDNSRQELNEGVAWK